MKYKPSKTTCHCGNPRRPNARNCSACHREAQRTYRLEMKKARLGVDVYTVAVRAFKRQLLLGAIQSAKGNLCRAAMSLGVHRSTVTRVMREVGLSSEQVKQHVGKGEGMRPRKKVLCVSANEQRLSCQTFLLETRGFCVLPAASAEDALTILEASRPATIHVMVAEWEMQQGMMDGDELTRRAKQLHAGLPVLLLSYEICGHDHHLFADVFLPKGCNAPAELVERVRTMAARKRGPKAFSVPSSEATIATIVTVA
jgi:DNA-binding NtrC family response regulator